MSKKTAKKIPSAAQRELPKSRGLNADAARRCCRWNALRKEQTIVKLVGDVLDAATAIRSEGSTGEEISVTGTLEPRRASGAPPSARVLSDFERLLLKSPPSEFERLARLPTPTSLKIQRAPAGSPLGLGAVVLIGAQGLSSFAAQTATLETLTGVVELLDKVNLTDDCVGCLKKALWSQAKKQVKTLESVRKRV